MKFLNYLMSKINFFQKNDDFIKIDKFYIFKKQISFNDLNKILKKKLNIKLLKQAEFDTIVKYNPKIIEDSIKGLNLNFDEKTFFFISDYEGKTNKFITFYFQNNKIKKEKIENIKDFKGIALFKKILTKEEIIKNKKYNSLNDLIRDENIAIYHKEESQKDQVICYDTSKINYFTNFNDDFKLPILFSGIVIHDDRLINKISQNGSIIDGTAAREDVFGRMTLYPILAFLAKDYIVMPDRDSISDSAKSVWDDFFNKKFDISKKAPIDDYDNPITINNKLDDGRIYIKDKFTNKIKLYDYKKIQKMNDEQQQKFLNDLRKNDPYNWTYKLTNINEIKSVLNKLKQRHMEFIKTQESNFIDKLERINSDFYSKNIT